MSALRWSDEEVDEYEQQPTTEPETNLSAEWHVQGRRRHAVKKEAVMRTLMVFASLPWAPKLLFRGIVVGEAGLLELVHRKQYAKFHGYDPVSKQLVWRVKPADKVLGVQKADDKYIARVEQEFAALVDKLRAL